MDLTIKEATINDLEEVLKLNKALFEYETKFNTQFYLNKLLTSLNIFCTW